MKKNKNNNKNKNTTMIMIVFGCIIALILGIIIGYYKDEYESKNELINNIDIKYNNGNEYYIITGDYNGEYDYQEVDLYEYREHENGYDEVKEFNKSGIYSYNEYSKFCYEWNLDRKYDDENKNYLIISYESYGSPIVEARVADAILNDDMITLYMWENIDGVTADIGGYFIAIPVDKNVTNYDIVLVYTESEYENIIKYGSIEDPSHMMTEDKPIIYIYPEKDMDVSVKLLNSNLITVSYPKYNDGWNVTASINGNLKDKNTNKNYYALYYESSNHNVSVQKDGFVIEGKDTIEFLESKLSILGLNDREINEFIIYWLPKLENNKYVYIRFETNEEINNYMPLEITPVPDTLIRVVMDFKVLDEKIDVEEQKLNQVKRNGYTVVEWGGSEIK